MPAARKPTIKVVPGQIWADADRRGYGRRVRVIDADATRATVQAIDGGRKSRVLCGEYGLRGYRLVSQPDESDKPKQGYAWCFSHGTLHTFDAEPWCTADWVPFSARSEEEALEGKAAAYGDVKFFDDLPYDKKLEVLEIRKTWG